MGDRKYSAEIKCLPLSDSHQEISWPHPIISHSRKSWGDQKSVMPEKLAEYMRISLEDYLRLFTIFSQ